MDKNHYDLLIAGGGLAGLSLAILVARKGFKVGVIEKGTYPRHRVCGEYIAMESWPFLEELGIPLKNMNLPLINQLRVSSPHGRILESRLNPGGFGISRFYLDKIMADKALEYGVDLKTNISVKNITNNNNHYIFETDNGDFFSRQAIGGFGKRSILDRTLNRNLSQARQQQNFVGIKYHFKGPFPENLIELHVFRQGYCGISRVEGDEICVCYLTIAENIKTNGSDIEQMEKKLLMANPNLANRINSFTSIWEKPLSIAQISFGVKGLQANGLLLGGDAAGMIAPLCGNGMSMAMNSSALLAPLVISNLTGALSEDDMARIYQNGWLKTFRLRIKVGNVLQGLMLNSSLIEPTISILSKVPFVTKRLISLTHGEPFND